MEGKLITASLRSPPSAAASPGPIPVLLTNGELVATLAGVRALRRAGYAPWVAATDAGAYAARSRARAGLILTPNPRRDPAGFAGTLAAACNRHGVRALLPMGEDALIALTGREPAFPTVALGTVPRPTLERSLDKTALEALAATAGLMVPPTTLMGATDAEHELSGVAFPAVVKALRSELPADDGTLRRWGVQMADDAGALRAALARLPHGRGLVQPCLPGRLSAVGGVAWKGQVICAVHFAAQRLWPPRIGAMSAAVTVAPDRTIERALGRLLATLGWSGLYQIQFIDTPTGRYLIDLNPRAFASLSIAIAAGLNLPAIWAAYLLGRPAEVRPYRLGVRFRAEWNDLQAIGRELGRADNSSALAALRPRRRTAHAVLSLDDPRPLLALASEMNGRIRSRLRQSTSSAGLRFPGASALSAEPPSCSLGKSGMCPGSLVELPKDVQPQEE